MTPELTAIIVNFNAGDELRGCLQSIADAMRGRHWQAVVIDNASSDGSAAFVEAFAPHARLIRNATNIGFGRAVNQGIAISRRAGPFGPALEQDSYVLIINPDCRLEHGAIEQLGTVLQSNPSCAIAGPLILDPDGAVQGSARGDPDMLTGLFGRRSPLRRLLPGLPISKRNVVAVQRAGSSQPETGEPRVPSPESRVPSPESRVVDWVSGACMLARRDALEAVDGFDERYFLYWEDADLCRRLRARGYHIRYVPGGTAIHRVGQSSRTARHASIRAFHESAYLYYITHVAPDPANPKRWLARLLLKARCRWLLRS